MFQPITGQSPDWRRILTPTFGLGGSHLKYNLKNFRALSNCICSRRSPRTSSGTACATTGQCLLVQKPNIRRSDYMVLPRENQQGESLCLKMQIISTRWVPAHFMTFVRVYSHALHKVVFCLDTYFVFCILMELLSMIRCQWGICLLIRTILSEINFYIVNKVINLEHQKR